MIDSVEDHEPTADIPRMVAMLEGPLDATSDGILLLDTTGKVIWFNRRFATMFGFAVNAIRGVSRETLLERMSEQMVDAEGYRARVREIIASDEPEVRDVLTLRDNRFFERTSRRHTVAGARVGRILTYRDVTHEHHVEAALEHSEARFREVIAASPDGIVMSRNWKLIYANAAFANALGRSEGDLVGMKMLDLLPPEDRTGVAETASRIMSQQEAGSLRERRFLTADGAAIPFEVAAHRIEIGGEPTMVLFLRDVRERRRMQAQLAVHDRMAAIGAMAAGIAHEINNPLAYVLANLELMRDSTIAFGNDPTADQLEALRKMQALATEGCQRIKEVVADLATLSRTGANEDTERLLDVRWTLDSSIALARALISTRARIVTEYAEAPLIRANDARLAQVFSNLLLNAAQAIEPGKPELNEIRVRCGVAQNGNVFVSISDTGGGIPAGNHDRIFEPFFTTKPDGTGLGLSICQSIVCGLGGQITADSQTPRGTTFRIELPPCTSE
jgi:PAS domain S-box-containing protein